MVSYHNPMMYSKSHTSNLAYGPYHHWYGNYAPSHHASNAQYLSAAAGAAAAGNVNGDIDNSGAYFNSHPHHHPVFHQASPDWTAHDNYGPTQNSPIISPPSAGTPISHQHHHHQNHHGQSANQQNGLDGNGGAMIDGQMDHMGDDGGMGHGHHTPPSPPITVNSGCSEMSSPGIGGGGGNGGGAMSGTGDDTNTHLSVMSTRPPQPKSPYEWMKKPSYQSQPQPGKTRTKDKYRVVYTDYQRLELEKEYITSSYITIRRKSELAQSLQLSERQVKIWFQNRRAKFRKQQKKTDPTQPPSIGNPSLSLSHIHAGLDIKPKLEPGLMPSHSQYGGHLHNIHHHHLSHTMHQMGSMASMGSMAGMGLHNISGLHLHHSSAPLSASPLPSAMSMTSQSQHNLNNS